MSSNVKNLPNLDDVLAQFPHLKDQVKGLIEQNLNENVDRIVDEKTAEIQAGMIRRPQGLAFGQQANLQWTVSHPKLLTDSQLMKDLWALFDKELAMGYLNEYWIRLIGLRIEEIVKSYYMGLNNWANKQMGIFFGKVRSLRAFKGFERDHQIATITHVKEFTKHEEEKRGGGLAEMLGGSKKPAQEGGL